MYRVFSGLFSNIGIYLIICVEVFQYDTNNKPNNAIASEDRGNKNGPEFINLENFSGVIFPCTKPQESISQPF